jgi:mRNA-degrading endonuclease toxin of MazEF toxin-antitoxin module
MENNKEREAKEYVAEIMRQRAVNAPKPGGPRHAGPRPALLAVLAVLLVSLIAWNLTAGRRPPVVVSPDKVEASARLTVYLVAQAIETYRDTTRTLPRNLEDLGVDGVGITYAREASTYTLTVEIGGTQLTYRSGESLEPYRAAAEVLLGGLR